MEALIGEVPDDWDETSLGDLCEILAGPSGVRSHSEARPSAGVPVIAPRDISNNRIVKHGLTLTTPAVAERLSRYRLVCGDIVCARTGELGRQALVTKAQEGWLFGTACLRLRPSARISPQYLIYYFGHPNVHDWVKRNATGSAIASLNTRTLASMPVAVPPQAAQKAIGEVLSALDDKIAIHEEISRTTADLRDTLLPGLVGGATAARP